MNHWVYDLKNFYASRAGRLVRRILNAHIRLLWPDSKGLRVVGIGYPVPYLSTLDEGAGRSVALMPGYGGVHPWPEGQANRVALFDGYTIPLESESVDRIFVIHGFEMVQDPEVFLGELWRVLKSSGRLMLVMPNRLGFWARADWTPFGAGRPFTMTQINHMLQQNLFVRERVERALFMPPFRSFLLLRFAYSLESFGKFFFPGFAGLYIVEASKQIYAGTRINARAQTGRRRVMVSAELTP